jgi:hypothetical protein
MEVAVEGARGTESPRDGGAVLDEVHPRVLVEVVGVLAAKVQGTGDAHD